MRKLRNITQFVKYIRAYFSNEPTYINSIEYPIGDIYIIIRSWNRPIYLWACLDNIYRTVRTKVKFIMVDNASTDPQIKNIIRGFEKRGMFHAVHYMDKNSGNNQQEIFDYYQSKMGKYFIVIDADIMINFMSECWVLNMVEIMERNPHLSILGSILDQSDFVSYNKASEIEPKLTPENLERLIKWNSPERNLFLKNDEVIYPFDPAGRILIAKTSIIRETGIPIGNKKLCKALTERGYSYGITTRVTHRHLSLLNIFDYPDYDFIQLNKYLKGI